MLPNRSELSKIYGRIDDGRWARESEFMEKYPVPAQLLAAFRGAHNIYSNKDMWPALDKALHLIIDRKLEHTIHSFDGCFNIRIARNSSLQSVHSWGLALDFNCETNQLGTNGDIDTALVACFEESNFVWGGRWKRPDPMHFQYVTEE